jgi:Domain of unknown function (DUF4262)
MSNGVDSKFAFSEPRNAAVFVCSHVLDDGLPILRVSHDADGDWQFLCGAEAHEVEHARLVCLEGVVGRDASVNALASMCTTHTAERDSEDDEWVVVDRTLEFVRATIDESGWWVGLVAEDEDGPGFAYTIGLLERFDHPEIMVIGLAPQTMHRILNVCGELVRAGARFRHGASCSDVLDGHHVQFRQIFSAKLHAEYAGIACRHYRSRDFTLLQCLWPDRAGVFPSEPGCDDLIVRCQPMLG